MIMYLDNAATTPLSKEMGKYLTSVLGLYANPSSSYKQGNDLRLFVELVRGKVAEFINANNGDIIFTSSGSAANTLGIKGFVEANDCEVCYSPTLHKSALKCINDLDCECKTLKINNEGIINAYDLILRLEVCKTTPFVVVEYANSENGTIQPIKEICDIVHSHGGIVMVDCTGSISSIPLDIDGLDIDIATFSAHKIGALKGIGILYKYADINLKPLVYGAQEEGLFAGTENVLGIASLGKAIDLMDYNKTSQGRDFVWNNLKNIDDVYLIGAEFGEHRLINNLYVCVKGVNGQDIVTMMDDLYDTQISTGSACNSGIPTPSSTLVAVGIPKEDLHSCIRMSFSGKELQEQLQTFCDNITTCINMLRNN